MKKRVLIIFTALLFVLALLFVSFYFFYLRKVTIYEAISISFPGITSSKDKSIEVYSITPLGRKKDIAYSESENCWWQNNGYHKTINIIIPDTLLRKTDSIKIIIGEKIYFISIGELKFTSSFDNKSEYSMPGFIRSEDSFVKILQSLLKQPIGKIFQEVLLSFSVLLILVFIMIKWGKIKSIFLSFLVFFDKKLKQRNVPLLKILKWFKIIGVSIFIACVLFFGFLLLKFCVANYITSIIFILLTGILQWFIVRIILKIFQISPSHFIKIKKLIFLFLLLWFCIETFLRIEGTNMSSNEKNGSYYSSGFNTNLQNGGQNPHLLVHPKYYTGIHKTNEFTCQIKCNYDGLRDIDHSIKKEKNEYRIICLGNSFTEGIGAPQDSTWPKLFENHLKDITKRKISVFNAGKGGSDPFFEYMLLKEKMLNYRPDIVLLTLGSSDFNFYTFRGGFERFTSDGCNFRNGPAWEKLYAVSFIFRYYINDVLQYKNFMSQSDCKNDSIKAIQDINQCIERFYQLSLENKFKLIVVFYDDSNNGYSYIMNKLKFEKTIPVIDLFEYNKNVEKITRLNNSKYYWPIDGHCNSKGYDLLARGVLWNLNQMGFIDTLKTE